MCCSTVHDVFKCESFQELRCKLQANDTLLKLQYATLGYRAKGSMRTEINLWSIQAFTSTTLLFSAMLCPALYEITMHEVNFDQELLEWNISSVEKLHIVQ